MLPDKLPRNFSRFAAFIALQSGTSWAFFTAVMLVLVWGLLGPHYHYSNTWQLVVNTATTIITFLMVFLIQNTQNRDTRAINLKLDEIIRSMVSAHNEMIDIEKLSDEELKHLEQHYERIRKESERRRSRRGRGKTEKAA
jgi:low affinity Fe/Cu permease